MDKNKYKNMLTLVALWMDGWMDGGGELRTIGKMPGCDFLGVGCLEVISQGSHQSGHPRNNGADIRCQQLTANQCGRGRK